MHGDREAGEREQREDGGVAGRALEAVGVERAQAGGLQQAPSATLSRGRDAITSAKVRRDPGASATWVNVQGRASTAKPSTIDPRPTLGSRSPNRRFKASTRPAPGSAS